MCDASKMCACCSPQEVGCRIVKDAVCFHGACFQQVAEKLVLDLHEPPMSQVNLISVYISLARRRQGLDNFFKSAISHLRKEVIQQTC